MARLIRRGSACAWARLFVGAAVAWNATAIAQAQGTPQWRQLPPIGGFRTIGAYEEPSTGALFVFGGDATGVRTWRLLGSWSEIVDPAPPQYLDGICFAYDSTRNVAMMFGGQGYQVPTSDETWEFDGQGWQQLAPAQAPPARWGAAMAFDPVRQRIVLFGGRANSTPMDDTWEFDGVDWVQISTANAPHAQANATMTFDAANQRLLLLGAQPPFGQATETWTYDGIDWTQTITANAPTDRRNARMAYDPIRAKTVLFGGLSPFYFPIDDTWEFDGGNWQQIQTATIPLGRADTGVIWSQTRGHVLAFGGWPGGTAIRSSAAHTFDGVDWTPIMNEVPFFVGNPTVAFDSSRARIVLHGGNDGTGTPPRNTWEHDGSTWQQTASNTGPDTNMVYDQRRQRIVAFDGGTTWEYDSSGWSQQTLTPSPPVNGATWFDRHDGVVKVANGSQVWSYDGAGWTTQTVLGSITTGFSAPAVHFSAIDRAFVSDLTWNYYLNDGVQWQAAPVPPSLSSLYRFVEDVRAGVIIGYGGQGGDNLWFDGQQWHTSDLRPNEVTFDLALTADSTSGRVFGVNRTGAVWELSWPDSRMLTRFGRGCAGSNGTPRLDGFGTTAPTLGQTLPLQLSSLPSAPGIAVVTFGDSITQSAGVPLPASLQAIGMPGCKAWVSMLAAQAVAHQGNAKLLTLMLPANASLAGVLLGFQALVLDPSAGTGIGSASNAVLAFAY